MKTLYFTIILFVSILFSMGLSKQTAYAEDENPPVVITQVELGSPLVLALDNQTCTFPPDPKLTNNCRTDLIPGHNVMCSYFIGSSTCEPLHQVTSGTNQSCLGDFSIPGAPQWFDMYNISDMTVDLQNFTAFDKLNYGPYGNDGPFSTIIELKPHEKCTFPWPPVDEALSMGLNNMSMSISYNYGGKYYSVSTPSFSDTYNDTRTWQFDGNKWSFAQNGTMSKQNMTTSDHPTTLQESPLNQFKSGVAAQDVKCGHGFELIIRSENDIPACVQYSSVQKLVDWGLILTRLSIDDLKETYGVGEKINATINFQGIMHYCDYPRIQVLDSNQNIVLKSKERDLMCVSDPFIPLPYVTERFDLDSEYGGSIMINDTGSYTIKISLDGIDVEKGFAIGTK